MYKYKSLDQTANGSARWLDERPGPPLRSTLDIAENVTKDKPQHTILVRMARVTLEGVHAWKPIEFEIRSPHISGLLVDVLNHQPVRDLVLLPARFQPLFYRVDEIRAYIAMKKDLSDEAREHFDAFQDTVLSDMDKDEKALRAFHETRTVRFDSLWVIFAPDSMVLWEEYGSQQIMKLTQIQLRTREDNRGKDERHWEVAGVQVDWNGMYFGHVKKTVRIFEYAGEEMVENLAAMPLTSHPSSERIYEKMLRRGAKFAGLRGYHVKAYNGAGYLQQQHGEDEVPVSMLKYSDVPF